MRGCLFVVFFFIISFNCFSQEGRWAAGLGVSTYGIGKSYFNIRVISPFFKYEDTDKSDNEKGEKKFEKTKRGKFAFELIIPPINSDDNKGFLLAENVYYRFIKKKFLSVSGLGGVFFMKGLTPLRKNYFGYENTFGLGYNVGVSIQTDFGFAIPYLEFSKTGLTIGAEFKISKLKLSKITHLKLRRRYHLDLGY